jgi:hypothetical protein
VGQGDRVSGAVKCIRVRVASKKAVKCTRKCRESAKHTPRSKSGAQALKLTLRRTRNRNTYLVTLNRPT